MPLFLKIINSLKGENEISFDAEPLSSAGIFAITGPTGSGKSTILDVITPTRSMASDTLQRGV